MQNAQSGDVELKGGSNELSQQDLWRSPPQLLITRMLLQLWELGSGAEVPRETWGQRLDPPVAMSRELIRILAAMLVGFGVGCAIIHIAGGQSLAVTQNSIDMSLTNHPAQTSQFMGRRGLVAGSMGLTAAAVAKQAKAGVVTAPPTTQKRSIDVLPILAPAVAISWAGFNILGPAFGQLNNMQDKNAAKKGSKKR